MTADPITAPLDMDLEEAAQVMLDHGFRHLPVVEGSSVVGVVSLRRVLGGRRQPASEAVAEAAPGSAPAPEAA
jgi:CBS-domain-containing membrane protein